MFLRICRSSFNRHQMGNALLLYFYSRINQSDTPTAVSENGGWKIKQIVFVGGTCGSVHAQTFNENLKELGVIKSKSDNPERIRGRVA
jgi:hypothetical protein